MYRTGVDIVDIARFEASLARFPRLAARLFTDQERGYCAGRPRPGESLAARFAAKEATFKALGEGWPRVSWHEVEVVPGPSRRPSLVLTGKALALAGGGRLDVSLAHDGGLAIATVILERPDPGRPGP